jgi:nucleotide-binding universal stress UspA family protein
MKKILLIISFLRSSPKTIEEALKLAKSEKAELLVFFVLDIGYADKIAHKLADEGWIGGKPSEQLYTALLKEYKLQAEMKINEIDERAKVLDVPVRSQIKTGPVLASTLEMAEEENPDLIVITRRKRSSLSRLIFGSLVGSLKSKARCDVKIIDEA